MVKFNDLYLVKDKLTIDVEIEDLEYYNNMSIKNILIDTNDTFIQDYPSEKAKKYEVNNYSHIDENFDIVSEFNGVLPTEKELSNGRRRVRYITKSNDFLNKIIYVYIEVQGIPDTHTPCSEDKRYYLGVTYDLSNIYNKALSFIKKEESSKCGSKNNTAFIDFILNKSRFDLALDTGNYKEANKLIQEISHKSSTITNKCKCNG